MTNRCYVKFEAPRNTSPASCLYKGVAGDDEEDVAFSFQGPRGLLDRAEAGCEVSINELLGRIYMGCEPGMQGLIERYWAPGFELVGLMGDSDMIPTQSITEATAVVFAERAHREMTAGTDQPNSVKPAPRI